MPIGLLIKFGCFPRSPYRRKPIKPKPPKEPPPPPKLVVNKQVKPTLNKVKMEIPNIDLPTIAGGGPFLGNWQGNPLAEGDVLPIVRIDPQWPRKALVEGIEGYVVVEVTIATDGAGTFVYAGHGGDSAMSGMDDKTEILLDEFLADTLTSGRSVVIVGDCPISRKSKIPEPSPSNGDE